MSICIVGSTLRRECSRRSTCRHSRCQQKLSRNWVHRSGGFGQDIHRGGILDPMPLSQVIGRTHLLLPNTGPTPHPDIIHELPKYASFAITKTPWRWWTPKITTACALRPAIQARTECAMIARPFMNMAHNQLQGFPQQRSCLGHGFPHPRIFHRVVFCAWVRLRIRGTCSRRMLRAARCSIFAHVGYFFWRLRESVCFSETAGRYRDMGLTRHVLASYRGASRGWGGISFRGHGGCRWEWQWHYFVSSRTTREMHIYKVQSCRDADLPADNIQGMNTELS